MTGVLKRWGFRLSPAEKIEWNRKKYNQAIARVKADLKQLRSKNINANSQPMQELAALAGAVTDLDAIDTQGGTLAETIDNNRKELVKQANTFLNKKQKVFEEGRKKARADLAELTNVAIDNTEKAELEAIRVRLEEGELTKFAGQALYDRSISLLKSIQEELQERDKNLSPDQKKYMKALSEVKADLQELYAENINKQCQHVQDLEALAVPANTSTILQRGSDLAKDIDRDRKRLVAEAKTFLKKTQHVFEEELKKVRGDLAERKSLAVSEQQKAALEAIRVKLEEGDLAQSVRDATYDLNALRTVQKNLDAWGDTVSPKQKKYMQAINAVKAAIKQQYKENINARCPTMAELESLAGTTANLESILAQGDELAEVINKAREKLVGEAKAFLKTQQQFEKELTRARKDLAELKYVAVDGQVKNRLDALGVDLEQGQLATHAKAGNYDEALRLLQGIQQELKTRGDAISPEQKNYIKERDKVQASLGRLLVMGFAKNSPEYTDLEGKLANADRQARSGNWQGAYDGLDGWKKVMSRKAVKQANTIAKNKLADGTFKLPESYLEANKSDPPTPYDDLWARAVIDMFNIKPRLDKGDFHNQDIKLQIGPKDYHKYKRLQETIAGTGLEENQRPTINLTVKGKNAPVASFGIIGGTGPLSDAEMLEKTMEGLEHAGFSEDDVHIRLLSAPPPRAVDGPLGGKVSKKTVRYTRRTLGFASEPHSKMALASNTAHANLGMAQFSRFLGGGGRKRKYKLVGEKLAGTGETHQVQDLSAKVVDSVQNDSRLQGRAAKPLVMGTKDAYDKNLYPDKFDATGVTAEMVEPKDSILLQEWIDDAKRGKSEEAGLAEKLKTFIKRELAKNPNMTHVILGCTELPLAFGGKANIMAFETELNQERDTQNLPHVFFVDTEDVFAQQYTQMAMANARESHPAALQDEAEGDETIELEDETRTLLLEKKNVVIDILLDNLKEMAAQHDAGTIVIEDDDVEEDEERNLIGPSADAIAEALFNNITDNEPTLDEIVERFGIPQRVLRIARDAALGAWQTGLGG